MLNTAPAPVEMKPPVHVAVPALSMVRLRRVLVPVPLNSSTPVVAGIVRVPAPLKVPDVHLNVLPTRVRSPAPVRVPPASSKFSAVIALPPVAAVARVTVPVVMRVKPAPVMVVPTSRV